ncbi:type VI secretion system-associated protein TagF [Pseudomonas silvicola]|nr:type VI secretion system-associated protein TagF [Pseudomonas silvicola]
MRQAGFYGKLASLGDFIHRDLPQGFIQPWDTWLATGLRASQAQLGDAWLDAYLISPLWRFVLAPGLCGEQAMTGVLMPSVDRVGRYFPLTVARPLAVDTDLGALVGGAQAWFEAVEEALLGTLEPQAAPQHFEQALAGLPALATTSALPWDDFAGLQRSRAETPAARQTVLGQWACQGASLWWGTGSQQVAAGLLRCQGMPASEVFTRFLQSQRGPL